MNERIWRIIAGILAVALAVSFTACSTEDSDTGDTAQTGDTADITGTEDPSGEEQTTGGEEQTQCLHSWSLWQSVAYDRHGRVTEQERSCLLCLAVQHENIDYGDETDGDITTGGESAAETTTEAETEAKTEADTEADTEATTGAFPDMTLTEAPLDYENTQQLYGMGQGQTKYTHVLNAAEAEGFAPMTDFCKLYDMCPTVNGVRVYSLTNSRVELSSVAAVPLAQLLQAAYEATGMVANVRTGDNFTNPDTVGYADYKSNLSVRISYYDPADKNTYDFSHPRVEALRSFIQKNAAAYGFVELSCEQDPGHFRYVGVPHAPVMAQKGMELAEYGSYLQSLAREGKSLHVTLGEDRYTVTSFAMTNGVAAVKAPLKLTDLVDSASALGEDSLVLTVRHRPAGALPYDLPYKAPVAANRSDKVICLDAGHGRIDSGAVYGTYQEKTLNLAAAQAAAKYLKAMGYTVIFTREGDTTLTNGSAYSQGNELAARVNYAKSNGADLYISFHCNSTDNPSSPTAIGPQLYFNSSQNTKYWNYTIANTFRAAMNEGLAPFIADGRFQSVDEGDVRDGNYYVLSDMSLPSILIEMGFICNDKDVAMLSSPLWQEAMGYSVAVAVENLFAGNYLGLQ